MNKNDEDIDLRLALGSRNYSAETRKHSKLGAGVNANSRVDVPFAPSDPLSELVWSPHNGLTLKSANPSSKEILTSHYIRDNKVSAGQRLSMIDRATVFRSSGGSSTSEIDVNRKFSHGGSKGLLEKDTTAEAISHKGNDDVVLCTSQTIQIGEGRKANGELDVRTDAACDRKSKIPINWKFPSRNGITGSAVPINKVSEALVCSIPNLQIDDEAISAAADANNTQTDNAPLYLHLKLESSAENDLGHNLVAKEVDLPPTSSRKKGKEKALSDGDIYAIPSNEKEDSHESVESCNSAAVFPKGIKRQHYDEEQPVDSKRVKADSSFMNWISNMVKGLPDSNKKESSLAITVAHSNNFCSNNQQESFTCKKTTDFSKPTGFQNVFQSLYCQTNKKENKFIAEPSELMVADLKSLDSTPQSCNRNDSSSKQIILSGQPDICRSPIEPRILSAVNSSEKMLAESKSLDIPECSRAIIEVHSSGSLCKNVDAIAEKMDLDIPLPMTTTPEKVSPLTSLWVTRLYTRSAKLENCNPIAEEATDCNSDGDQAHSSVQRFNPNESVELNYSHGKPSLEVRSSEAMVSVFAKRLDALRHIIHPSERRKTPTCFFCGNSGHDLRKCPQLTETELENILVNINSFDRADESPCLCIRCFQLDHWAISCPLAEHRESNQNSKKLATCHLSGDDNCSSYFSRRKLTLGSFPSFLNWNMKESSSKRFTSNELQKSTSLNLDKQIFPPCKPFSTQIAVPEEEMFHAIRKLRLSRADILRCMDSNVCLSQLNGFFLRLRLGELEGVGGTGYYVACITGESREDIVCKSKKSVLVDVGGIKSSVGSQYISNHDFLEAEIKYWWSRIEKTGGAIPSLDVLKSKFEDKKCLGL